MGLKGTEKDRIVGKNVIEGRRTDGNRRRRTENVREQILRNTKPDWVHTSLELCKRKNKGKCVFRCTESSSVHHRDIPACSQPFLYDLCLFPSVPSFSVVFLIIPSSVPFHVFRLFLSIPLFQLVSFQVSILGSDRSEFRSLLLIRLHFCSATIPFPVDLQGLTKG